MSKRKSVWTDKVGAEIAQHPGEWIAFTRKKLICTGNSAVDVIVCASFKGYTTKDYVLWYSPKLGMQFY